jgi:hypothetical protein
VKERARRARHEMAMTIPCLVSFEQLNQDLKAEAAHA